MATPEKACPIVSRRRCNSTEILAFIHPEAGKQFVKGTIKKGETPEAAARRELHEESGIIGATSFQNMGVYRISANSQRWHFFYYPTFDLPETWDYETEDDFGHTFKFFWHPVHWPLNADWHPIFHQAFDYIVPQLICK
jgi:8-oxo-dGTP pyrophosphatase MutT (NUDIX family)